MHPHAVGSLSARPRSSLGSAFQGTADSGARLRREEPSLGLVGGSHSGSFPRRGLWTGPTVREKTGQYSWNERLVPVTERVSSENSDMAVSGTPEEKDLILSQ